MHPLLYLLIGFFFLSPISYGEDDINYLVEENNNDSLQIILKGKGKDIKNFLENQIVHYKQMLNIHQKIDEKIWEKSGKSFSRADKRNYKKLYHSMELEFQERVEQYEKMLYEYNRQQRITHLKHQVDKTLQNIEVVSTSKES